VAPAYIRALSRQFSISAPRMAVRTHLAWPWRAVLVIGFIATIAGMWWWGYDFGQLLGGFNQRENEQRLATLAADTATAQREAAALRTRNTQLESELAMMRGVQATLRKQQAEVLQESAHLKDELAFFRQFLSDSSKAPAVGIHRITLDGNGSNLAHYSVLITRGGSAKTDFDGQLALQAELVPTKDSASGSKPLMVSLPRSDGTEAVLPMKLKFKYYQRVDGTIPLPPGYAVRTLTARAYESGSQSPRATRTLTLP
jgi:hypothetical protein